MLSKVLVTLQRRRCNASAARTACVRVCVAEMAMPVAFRFATRLVSVVDLSARLGINLATHDTDFLARFRESSVRCAGMSGRTEAGPSVCEMFHMRSSFRRCRRSVN